MEKQSGDVTIYNGKPVEKDRTIFNGQLIDQRREDVFVVLHLMSTIR